ncbi:uncharacterized protein UV8b_05385 [Ustilaginoidea virens]|uniref:ribonuclease T1 n=1 Tax=Ustilaginoidea virens TaxID=1159556 RepID=A0A8E5MJ11_USTVR|nr:uncharacterized protein UV8b_05385 [Ustilaginoidea virens]QUC21142.1 hypothetical protein UV8b_05385 [Ustilaginoidea virens]
MHLALLAGLLVAATARAAPVATAVAGTTCGTVVYSGSAVQAAADAACDYVLDGGEAGSSSYPHRYNDYEGFYFGGVPGPYQEFPILASGAIYSGGRPGPDRVIITDDCEISGVITHTGASGNSFVGCSGTS